MNLKKIIPLFLVLGVLGLVLLFSEQNKTVAKTARTKTKVYEDFDFSKVSSVLLEGQDQSLKLSLENNQWVLPERGGYAADFGQIRSLLFKLARIKIGSALSSNSGKLKDFGLGEGEGSSITLQSGSGKELSKIRVGRNRVNRKTSPGMLTSGGQYLSFSNKEGVFLVPEDISVSTDVSSWIKSEITSVLSNKVLSVEQFALKEGNSNSLFKLRRVEGDGEALFDVEPVAGAGKQAKASRVALVAAALENLKIADVGKMVEFEPKFDMLTTYQLNNGLIYEVYTGIEDDKQYLKLAVVKAEKSKIEGEALAQENPAKEKKETKIVGPNSANLEKTMSLEEPDDSKAKSDSIKKVTVAEVDQLNKKHSKWLYQVPVYTSSKFRYAWKDLFDEISKE